MRNASSAHPCFPGMYQGHPVANLQELAEVEVTSEATATRLNLPSISEQDRAGALPRQANNGPGWCLISRSRSNACASSSMNPTSRDPGIHGAMVRRP